MAGTPVLLLASDRPDWLASVLAALAGQEGLGTAARPVVLVQDGARDPLSGERRVSKAVLRHAEALFRAHFPAGEVRPARAHLGPAATLARAERIAFHEHGAEAAIFLPEDLLPGRWYLATLHRLLELAAAEPRIAYVAAHGAPWVPLAAQRADPSRLVPLGASRGFAQRRQHWERLHTLLGDAPDDPARARACVRLGLARVNTHASYARWSGPREAEFASPEFRESGFAAPAMLEEDLFRPVPPGEAELRALIAAGAPAEADPPPPPDAEAALGRVRWLFDEGRFDEAETRCVEWLAKAPQWRDAQGHPAFLRELTRLALARGRLAEAGALADRLALEIAPGDACVNLLLAEAHARRGERAAARAEWQAALAKDPANAVARAALAADQGRS